MRLRSAVITNELLHSLVYRCRRPQCSGTRLPLAAKFKRRSGKDLYLGGGGQLCRSFLQEDLVDELFIGVGPVLLGDGIPGFPGKFPQRDFTLTECKSYSNGSVGLRYERIRTNGYALDLLSPLPRWRAISGQIPKSLVLGVATSISYVRAQQVNILFSGSVFHYGDEYVLHKMRCRAGRIRCVLLSMWNSDRGRAGNAGQRSRAAAHALDPRCEDCGHLWWACTVFSH
jgi:hypothetical protein